jgi:hypothetical protein
LLIPAGQSCKTAPPLSRIFHVYERSLMAEARHSLSCYGGPLWAQAV